MGAPGDDVPVARALLALRAAKQNAVLPTRGGARPRSRRDEADDVVASLEAVTPVTRAARVVQCAPKVGLALGYDVDAALERQATGDDLDAVGARHRGADPARRRGRLAARLYGTPLTPAMVFVAVGLLAGPQVLEGIDLDCSSSTVRTLAEATLALVLFCDASRIDLGQLRRQVGVPLRLLGIGLPLTIALGAVAAAAIFGQLSVEEALILAIVLAPTDAALGQAVVTEPAHPQQDPPGPQRRERPERRDLCAAVVRGRGRGRRGIRDLGRPQRGDAAARGDRLRSRGRRDRRARWWPRSSSTPAAAISSTTLGGK